MILYDTDSSHPSRENLVPCFKNTPEWVALERERMKWVPRGTPLTVRGIKTKGGFYMQNPKGASFSFAIDESLPVGRADWARPLRLRPRQYMAYHQLDPDQRAAFLHWLSNPEMPSGNPLEFCARLQVCASEWRLFMDRVPPQEVLSDLLNVFDRLDEVGQIPLLRLIGWCAYFQSRAIHLAVLEEMFKVGCRTLGDSLLRLALADCAAAQQPLWPELALAADNLYGSEFDRNWTHTDFQKRFMERFRVLHPEGLIIKAGPRRTQIEYLIHCPELRNERCRLDFPDPIEGTSLRAALDEVARPIINGPQLDVVKLRQIEADTLRVQKFLGSRLDIESDVSPVAAPAQPEVSRQLDRRSLDALREVIQRPQWTLAEFNALAKACGIMPLALQEKLNAWALDNFGETLLEGENPVAVNPQILERIRIYYDEIN